ncbi:hypothetical protein [Thiothrix lacustris]|uniref:hypothetical protein n=1 Tax=Thiothrix lacustris TaxID=525917 RepID=UPI0027E4A962|nr:hypothetical protein [Thiothrix lacustris]WMP17346.1 hypothetical protein RCS87_18455 [Thiothrix lacustris]
MSNHTLTPEEQAYIGAGSLQRGGEANQSAGIDWRVIHALIPWLAAAVSWLWWALFLVIPSVFGLHYAGMMPAMNNAAYTLMGLTLCLAATVAAQSQHGVRAIAFTFSVLLLAYWF